MTAQPDWARFVFQSRFAVSSGPFKDELLARNKQRNQQLKEWMSGEGRKEHFSWSLACRADPFADHWRGGKLLACVVVGEGQKESI